MKPIIYSYRSQLLLVVTLMVCVFTACVPDEEDYELGPKPTDPSFTITPIEGKINTYLLTAETKAATYQWDKGTGNFQPGEMIDTAYFAMAGEYTVRMNAFTQGGMVTAENTVTVAENDVSAGCVGDNLALLTGCGDSQTWVLAGEGSLWVGDASTGGKWWAIPADAVETRNCILNDEFTFYADGSFSYDNMGDQWVEGASPLGGLPADQCTDWSAVGAEYAAWGSNDSYTFSVNSDKITVTGLGAHLGIYSTSPTADNGNVLKPLESSTYEIVELTADKLVISVEYPNGGTPGLWRFTFRPKGSTAEPEPEEDPFAGLVEGDNLVEGSAMTSDEAWNIFNPGTGAQATTEFTENGLKFTNSTTEDSNVGVWQALEVEAGQKYKFSAHVKGSGATNTWFEVYFGKTEPVEGTDYIVGGYTGLNTWAGCGVDSFDGNIADLGCNDAPGTGAKGLVEFEESGTIYLVIKTGSNGGGSLGTEGITISDVKLVEMN